MGNELVVTSSQLKVYNVQEKVLTAFKVAEGLKCEDSKSRKVIAKFRADAKSIRSRVEKARLKKNREQTESNNDAAKAINDRLSFSIEAYDNEIKSYDQIKIDKAEAKARAEAERVALINAEMLSLKALYATTIEFNVSSENIEFRIAMVDKFDIEESTFQEEFPRADILKAYCLSQAGAALAHRKKWEDDQAENDRVRIENEKRQAELDRTEKENTKKLKIEQAKADKKAAAAKVREAELMAREKAVRDMEEKAAAKADLEKKIALFAVMAEDKETQLEKQKLDDFDAAMKDNAVFDAAWAIAKSIDTDIKNEKLKADKVRAGLIAEDKKALQDEINKIADFVSQMTGKNIKTNSAQDIYMSMQVAINKALVFAEIEVQKLI